MRSWLVVALLVPSAVDAETLEVGLGGTMRFEHQIDLSADLSVMAKIAPAWWVGGALGFGEATLFEPAGSGQGDTSLLGGRARVRYLRCHGAGCYGVDAGVGYQRVRMAFDDGLLMPPHRVDRQDTVFVEARGVVQLALADRHFILEASLGPTLNEAIYAEGGGFAAGVVTGIGLAGAF
jgi:hypothetical protein